MRSDFSLSTDLAAKEPTRVAEMKALFLKEAEKHHVLPLDDRMFERAIASVVCRPDLMGGRTSLTLAEGMTGMMENVFINVKNKSDGRAVSAGKPTPPLPSPWPSPRRRSGSLAAFALVVAPLAVAPVRALARA